MVIKVRTKIHTLQLDEKVIQYTHKVAPNPIIVKLSWKEIIKLLLKKQFNLQTNVYMNNDKIIHIIGLIHK